MKKIVLILLYSSMLGASDSGKQKNVLAIKRLERLASAAAKNGLDSLAEAYRCKMQTLMQPDELQRVGTSATERCATDATTCKAPF